MLSDLLGESPAELYLAPLDERHPLHQLVESIVSAEMFIQAIHHRVVYLRTLLIILN